MGHPALTAPFILHHIFLELPQHDLLLVQRVCCTWHDVITSSKVLLAALFMHPGPAPTEVPHAPPIRLNPLLESRFPSFFDNTMHYTTLRPKTHGMGPWYSTHWANDVRPWAEALERLPHTADLARESPALDLRRTAAYRRPEASWRRMAPCMPAPVELQVSYEIKTSLPPRKGTLRCLKFSNEDESSAGRIDPAGTDSGHLNRPWLTFGLLYDIIAAAWFRGVPISANVVQVDCSFQDIQPPVVQQGGPPWHIPQNVTPITRKNASRYSKREELRNLFAQKKIGGFGRILVFLTGYERGAKGEKRYKNEFVLDGDVMQNLVWDEEIEYVFS